MTLANTTGKVTRVVQTPSFKKAVKKLKPNQKADLDGAVREVMNDPFLGEQKKGDLAFLRVYKFKMTKQNKMLFSVDLCWTFTNEIFYFYSRNQILIPHPWLTTIYSYLRFFHL